MVYINLKALIKLEKFFSFHFRKALFEKQ